MDRVDTYDELRRIRIELNQAAASGTLTAEMLGSAFETEDRVDSESNPESVGMSWIWVNVEAFAASIDDPLGFFSAHLDNHYVCGVLHSPQLLRLIPESDRESFVREVVLRHSPNNNSWVKAVIDAGVPCKAVATMVLEKLHRTEVDPNRNVYNFLQHDFLQYGAGRIERPSADPREWRFEEEHTLWSVLTDEQFIEALRICIAKAPALLLLHSQKLRMRLSSDQLEVLLQEATEQLKPMNA